MDFTVSAVIACCGSSRQLEFVAFQEYSVQHETESFTKVHNEYNLPWSLFVGIAGLPGNPFIMSLLSKHTLTVA